MNNKKKALQGLRALGISSILVFHCGNPSLYQLACFGVCLFFIISGYLRGCALNLSKTNICSNVPRLTDSLYYSFIRIIPLYPLHIVMTLLSIPFSDIIPSLVAEGLSKVPFWSFILITNLTLTKALLPKYYFSFNGVSWFLSSYLIILLLTPYIQYVFKKRLQKKRNRLLLIITMLVVHFGFCFLISRITSNIEYWVYICPLARLPEYLIGMCMGSLITEYTKEKNNKPLLWDILSIISSVSLLFLVFFIRMPQWVYRSLAFIIPVTVLIVTTDINTTFLNKLFSQKTLIVIGDLSAYIFLIHQVLYNAIVYFGFTPDSILKRIMISTLVMGLSLILSWCYQKTIPLVVKQKMTR